MEKIKIRVIQLGHLNANVDLLKIENWNSNVFELVGTIEKYSLDAKSDLYNWAFSDETLMKCLPARKNEDFLLAITNVPLEDNWYSRRVDNNRIICTYYETQEILESKNIPLENLILNLLYSYVVVFKAYSNRIPSIYEIDDYTHDETRGCLFDMTGVKTDLVYSCSNTILCDECAQKYKKMKLSEQEIDSIKLEIKRIKKKIIYRFLDWKDKHQLLKYTIFILVTILLGAIGSILAAAIYP